MSAEWLLIALPLVFSLGWFAARLDIRHIRKSAGEIPQAYLRGLSQLLSRNEDKALDSFLAASEHDAVELQFAIGELSRRQGNHERALRVHRDLYQREDLPPATRNQALWALCEDYFNMGFIDYAQQHATLLLEDRHYQEKVVNRLLTIYQRRHDYQAALSLLQSLGDDALLLRRVMVAQFYCQFADLENDDEAKRVQHYEKALSVNPDCVRALLALAVIQPEAAKEHYQRIEHNNPQYLFLAVAPCLQQNANNASSNGGAEATLLRWLEAHPTPILFKKVYEALPHHRTALSESYLTNHHRLIAAQYWLEHHNAEAEHPHHLEAWLAIKTIIGQRVSKDFRCHNCGYEVNYFSWQCAGCMEWESLKPQ